MCTLCMLWPVTKCRYKIKTSIYAKGSMLCVSVCPCLVLWCIFPEAAFLPNFCGICTYYAPKKARRDAGDHWKYDAEYEDRRMDKDLENFRTNPLQSNVHHVPPVNENGLCSKVLSFMVIILSSKHMDDHRGTQWPIVAFVEIKR